MIKRLEIVDYGLIARATVDFADGATVFTGETGSGKTMILGALNAALGARAGADMVRRGASRARITLEFEPDDGLRARLSEDGFEIDAGEFASIAREITDAGKSSVRVNGRASSAGYVREIAVQVAEIVGQHEAQRLLHPTYHLALLDRFAGDDDAVASVAQAHAELVAAMRALDALAGDERKAKLRYDEAREAVSEIDALAPKPGEDEKLRERRRFLDNVEKITSALQTAHESLSGEESGATQTLGSAASALHAVSDMGELAAIYEAASALQEEVTSLATRLARELDAADFDPGEHESISARLDAIDRAKRKYGDSIEALLAHAEESRAAIVAYESKDEYTAALAREVTDAKARLNERAKRLSAVRAAASKKLSAAVVNELKDLALASARFEIALAPLAEVGPQGAEDVEFMFAANAGEPLRALAKVASGGELSRLLLAVIVALAAKRDPVALVFDEIDSGIGGATASAVGVRLGRLAKDGQVVAVTHLAQLATIADRHYVLEKSEGKGATTISVREIEGEEARAAELARMLSGETHDVALAHARTLLRSAR